MSGEQKDQTKARARFVRLAESRTTRVLKDLDLLGNLSNKSNYSYGEQDVKKIISSIRKRLGLVEKRFEANLKASERASGFKLEE